MAGPILGDSFARLESNDWKSADLSFTTSTTARAVTSPGPGLKSQARSWAPTEQWYYWELPWLNLATAAQLYYETHDGLFRRFITRVAWSNMTESHFKLLCFIEPFFEFLLVLSRY